MCIRDSSYDRDGNRRWISVESHPDVEHGYTSSPLLVDGKLIVYMGDLRALDANTGAVVWERPRYLPKGDSRGWRSMYHFHGSGCVVDAGGVKLIYFPNNEFVRLSDGRTVFVGFRGLGKSRTATPVVDDGLIYKVQSADGGVIVIKPGHVTEDRLKPEIVRRIPFDTAKFPRFYLTHYNASPLLYKGLMYCLDQDGVLTVLDIEKKAVCYQKMLDLDLYMYHNFGVGRGGAGSSPTLAGKQIYVFGNQGTCVVLEPGRTYKQVARNRLARISRPAQGAEHQEITMTCPLFEEKHLYLRAEDYLYCIGQ